MSWQTMKEAYAGRRTVPPSAEIHGLPYQRVPIDIFNGETLTDDFALINPMRTTPVLETEAGRHLPESTAILLYLAQGTHTCPRTHSNWRR